MNKNHEGVQLRNAVLELSQGGRSTSKAMLSEQPFDSQLLHLSPLYSNSRKLFLKGGGSFKPTLLSASRSLASLSLLDSQIEYSPIEQELIWCVKDLGESTDFDRLFNLRSYVCNVFHEQNHRILWKLLPPSVSDPDEVRKYLNFAESLVITLDRALSDHLGPEQAEAFYLAGVVYDAGTSVLQEVKSAQEYRRYLCAGLYSTYLDLELHDPERISSVIHTLFADPGPDQKQFLPELLNRNKIE